MDEGQRHLVRDDMALPRLGEALEIELEWRPYCVDIFVEDILVARLAPNGEAYGVGIRESGDLGDPMVQMYLGDELALLCPHILWERQPVCEVTNDPEEVGGGWQFLCAMEHHGRDPGEAPVVRVRDVLAQDPSLIEIMGLAPGFKAKRVQPGADWVTEMSTNHPDWRDPEAADPETEGDGGAAEADGLAG